MALIAGVASTDKFFMAGKSGYRATVTIATATTSLTRFASNPGSHRVLFRADNNGNAYAGVWTRNVTSGTDKKIPMGVVAAAAAVERAAAFDAAVGVASAGIAVVSRSAAIGASVGVAATGRRMLPRSSALGSSVTIAAAGFAITSRAAGLDAAVLVTVDGYAVLARAATLDAAVGISVIGERIAGRSTAFDAAVLVTAGGIAELSRSAALNIAVGITATIAGAQVITGAAAFGAGVGIDVAGEVAAPGPAFQADAFQFGAFQQEQVVAEPAFQADAFQFGAFQQDEAPVGPAEPAFQADAFQFGAFQQDEAPVTPPVHPPSIGGEFVAPIRIRPVHASGTVIIWLRASGTARVDLSEEEARRRVRAVLVSFVS